MTVGLGEFVAYGSGFKLQGYDFRLLGVGFTILQIRHGFGLRMKILEASA